MTQATASAASHTEGTFTTAAGLASHAEGSVTTAETDYSHAEGFNTNAIHISAHIMGQNGNSLYPFSWHVGNGDGITPGLAAVLQSSTGNMYIDGTYNTGGADYAEMFETASGKAIEPGKFVTLTGEKIRLATSHDEYTCHYR